MSRLVSVICLTISLFCASTAARAENVSLERFFGAFEGQTVFQDGEAAPRNLSVVIRRFASFGFTIRWRTVIFGTEEESRGRTQVIYFKPLEDNPSVFAATHPDDAAGLASGDPLDGRPFAWARISGDTLTISVLTISKDGGYVVQTYDRRLTADGLALAFLRLRDGITEQRVFGILKRADEQ